MINSWKNTSGWWSSALRAKEKAFTQLGKLLCVSSFESSCWYFKWLKMINGICLTGNFSKAFLNPSVCARKTPQLIQTGHRIVLANNGHVNCIECNLRIARCQKWQRWIIARVHVLDIVAPKMVIHALSHVHPFSGEQPPVTATITLHDILVGFNLLIHARQASRVHWPCPLQQGT